MGKNFSTCSRAAGEENEAVCGTLSKIYQALERREQFCFQSLEQNGFDDFSKLCGLIPTKSEMCTIFVILDLSPFTETVSKFRIPSCKIYQAVERGTNLHARLWNHPVPGFGTI